jgi:flagellum-specific ATP synthase
MAGHGRELMAIHRRNQDLINIGAYPMGSNPAIDQAIHLHEPLKVFLRQPVDSGFKTDESWGQLARTLATPKTTGRAATQEARS